MGTKNFSSANDLITFSRASGGTALRKVAYGPELVTNGDFSTDSDWTKQSAWTISDGQASYDDSGLEYIQSTTAFELTAGKTYEISYEIISGSVPVIGFLNDTASVNLLGAYQFPSTGINKAVFSPSSTVNGIRIYGNNSGSSFVLDNVSVKEVLFDQPNAPLTLFNHPAGIPRIEYDADGNVLGLLVEESRTNLATYSEDITQWSTANAPTVTSNIATAPDGTSTVDGVQSETGGAYRRVKPYNSTCTPNGTYTGSVFVKKETSETNYGGVVLNFTGGTAKACYGIIDAVAGTITAPSSGNTITATYSAVDIGDFWRFSITATDDGSNTSLEFGIYGTLSDDGVSLADSTGSVRKIWGAQLEAGAFPTSYIPTSGATATRAADVASIPVSAFGYNQSAGTVVANYVTYAPNANISAEAWRLADGSDFDSTIFQYVRYSASSNQSTVFGYSESSLDIDMRLSGLAITGTYHKSATAIKENDYALSIDGSTPATDSSAGVPSVSTLHIGGDTSGSRELNGHIKSIRYYPRRLTDAQLQELTT